MDAYIFIQPISFGWAAQSFILGTVLVCYFARNWPPQLSKLRFQLVAALAVIFVIAGIQEWFIAQLWSQNPEEMIEYVRRYHLCLQLPKVAMTVAGLFVIRALSWEIYGNWLMFIIATGLIIAAIVGYIVTT